MKDGARVLGLYGMGGVGKTTLLASINNKLVEEVYDFDLVIWVLASEDLQYEGIQDQILRRLRVDEDWEKETEEEKAYEIYNILDGKKFVLLLDDLWSKVDLNKVGVPRVTQQNGSKIVFTSRFEKICGDMEADEVMEVARLSPDEAWELFQEQLGALTLRSHPEIPTLARVVASICYGLPLALNAVGKSMADTRDVLEWSHAIEALVSCNEEFLLCTKERVFPLLKFSYDRLEDEKAKLCFLYCSLFPEAHEINKDDLIEYWKCEGLIDGSRGEEKQGRDIINLLVSAQLLMNCPGRVKMHGLVREVALLIATDFGKQNNILCVKSGLWLDQMPKDISWKVARRVCLMSNQIAEISCNPNCPNLSTLLLQKNKLVDISGEFFRFMPALVVLDLSDNEGLTGLPEEISNLVSLQYLNLSSTGIKSLPVGMMKLRSLIVLNLDFTYELEGIVGVVTSLSNLEVLKFYFSGVFIDDRLMRELQLLKHLKLLHVNVEDAAVLESLQRVVTLATCIRYLCIRKVSTPVVMLNTVALGGLQRLSVVSCKISEIKIDSRTTSPSFAQLSSITISGLEGPRDLTWVAYAQNLRYLYVMRSPSVQEVIDVEKGMRISNEHPRLGAPLKKLEHLEVSGMNELKIICQNPRALPNLREITVRACPKLPLSSRHIINN
ncbi:unnamed protein product [Thlaspi arvense]|uniref:NB-ARC domain-containing protein n=1 Tax=Thlaspi arvense TaxID=13288 RepID=A0AAU9RFZ5_THLAR|nr:unnamed protein product [Thlaspi arvense]